ncbi:MAG TPA: hypothetical protein VGE46_08505 [Bdellovibrio sp.]
MIRVFLFMFLLISTTSIPAFAQESSESPQYDEAREADFAQKAKKRLYAGGRDEEDLKTQSQVATPTRKLAPQAEIKEEPSEE